MGVIEQERKTSLRAIHKAPGYCVAKWLIGILVLACSAGAISDEVEVREAYRSLLDVSSFADEETQVLPEGWEVMAGDGRQDIEQPAAPEAWSFGDSSLPGGGVALCLNAPGPVTVLSPPLLADTGLQSISGSVLGTGEGEARVILYWLKGGRVLESAPMRAAAIAVDGRRRFNLSDSERPEGAEAVQLALVGNTREAGSFCWETARLTGLYSFLPKVTLQFNRIGYEQIAPKAFTVYSNFPAHAARFAITDEVGDGVYKADLGQGRQIRGADGTSWEGYYYRGDFTDLEEEGVYTVTVYLDECPPVSGNVSVRFNLLWEEAFYPAVQIFKSRRVSDGTASGFPRFWDDPGLNSESDAVLLWSLTQSWSLLRGRFPADPPLLLLEEEVLYGVGGLAAWMLDGNTGQIAGHSDCGLYLNSLTCVAHYKKEAVEILEAARWLMAPIMKEKRGGAWFFAAALDLYAATGEDAYLSYAREIYPGIVLERVESLLDYEYVTDTPITVFLREAFAKKADLLLASADNPFGLVRSRELSGQGFFAWDASAKLPLLGNTPRLLQAIEIASQAYRYSARKEYLVLVYNQLNWLMGNNPFGVCLISGLCREHEPPFVPFRDAAAETTGCRVLHGTGPKIPGRDIPHFAVSSESVPDENTNGYSLYNNAQYLRALAYLKRIPVSRPKP